MLRKKIPSGIIAILFLAACFAVQPVQAKGSAQNGKTKQKPNRVMTNDDYAPMDINNIFNYYGNNGDGSFNQYKSDNEGFEFPINYNSPSSGTCIFEDGLVWTAFKNGTLYCGGSTYNHGLQAGPILSNGTASSLPTPAPDDPKYKIYRVRPDIMPTSDAATQAKETNLLVSEASTENRWLPTTAGDLFTKYTSDWTNWPADEGAPWYIDTVGTLQYNDATHTFNPNSPHDIPGFPGADQTEWMVMNDVNPALTQNLYSSNPIGIEVQRTIWAYNRPGALGNTIFISYKVINKSGVPLDSMYVSQWADPDLGYAGDDAAGCDTTRSLGFDYNGEAVDANYATLGLPPPAVGFDFFQGPIVPGASTDTAIFDMNYRPGHKNLPMTAFTFFINGNATFGDPQLHSNGPNGTPQWYNLMRGLISTTGQPFPATVTGGSKFCYPGDPVTGTGPTFIGQGSVSPPADVRFCLNSGPFTMAPGDTQQVVVAALVGLGSDYLSSVTVLKSNDDIAQSAYNALFQLAVPPPQPIVHASELNNQIVLSWGDPTASTPPAKIEGFTSKGYSFEGYNVYQYPANSPTNGKLIATYDLIDGVKTIQDTTFSVPLGTYIVTPTEYGTDSGIKHSITITNDAFSGNPLVNDRDYYFAVTAYSYNPTKGVVPHALESRPAILNLYSGNDGNGVRPQTLAPGMTDTTSAGQSLSSGVVHAGLSTGTVGVTVVDPHQLTGDQYQVIFHNETYSLGSSGVWTDVTAASKAKRLYKPQDLTGSSVTSTASWSETKGSIDIHTLVDVVSPNSDFCDGVKLTFPAGVVIDKAYEPISNNTGKPIPFYFDQATNSIFYGDTAVLSSDTTKRTGNGVFAGGEDIVITVHPATVPMYINYKMYDDNFGATYVDSAQGFPQGKLVDITSVDTLAGPVANKIVTQKQWDVNDLTKGTTPLKNQTVVSGQDIYAQSSYYAANSINGPGGSTGSNVPGVGAGANAIFDGIQVAVNGSYTAPTTIKNIVENVGATSSFNITDFTDFGYADGTAKTSLPIYAPGAGGVPSTDINDLQQGYELKWTGVLGDTIINGDTVVITKSGGQLATLFAAHNYSLANHPLNPNPGSTNPFVIRIPFEVWNIDKNEQVNLLVYDREGSWPSQGFQVWNTLNRMYVWVVNTAYTTSVINPTSTVVADSATWNWAIFESVFNIGDDIKILYNKPIQMGKDAYTFTVPQAPQYSSVTAKQDISQINVFPNPYFGYNSLEVDKYDRWVRFTHLPSKATIRIFNLGGILVRTLVKNDNTQFMDWNLLNEHQLPVAAGMYIAFIDCGPLGTKTLKMAIIPEQQFLDHY